MIFCELSPISFINYSKPSRGVCDAERGNSFSITMDEITDKLNETTGEWMASHKSKYDYYLYHIPEYHSGNKHFKDWAHYQASTNIYQDSKHLKVKIFLKPVWVGKIHGVEVYATHVVRIWWFSNKFSIFQLKRM